jgi:hypothetical protein
MATPHSSDDDETPPEPNPSPPRPNPSPPRPNPSPPRPNPSPPRPNPSPPRPNPSPPRPNPSPPRPNPSPPRPNPSPPRPNPSPPRPIVIPDFPPISLNYLKDTVVFWGGEFKLDNDEVRLVNTCSFDNLLNALAVLNKIKPDFLNPINYPNLIERPLLQEILVLIGNSKKNENTSWNEAKKKYITYFIPINERPVLQEIENNRSKISKKKVIYQLDFFGGEDQRFIHYLQNFQTFTVTQLCETTCVYNNVALGNAQYILFFSKLHNQIILDYNWTGRCPVCNTQFDVYPNFLNINPQFFIIQPIRPNIIFTELPDLLHIGGKNYKLLCATIYDEIRDHFVSLLTIGNMIFFVDGIGRKCEVMPPFNQYILRRRNITTIEKHYKMPINSTLYYLI